MNDDVQYMLCKERTCQIDLQDFDKDQEKRVKKKVNRI